jgi:hypothetical protein
MSRNVSTAKGTNSVLNVIANFGPLKVLKLMGQ